MDQEKKASGENDMMLNLMDRFLKLQEKEVRWKRIRFVLLGIFIVGPLVAYALMFNSVLGGGNEKELDGGYASMVRIEGMISPNTEWSARRVSQQLYDAFTDEKAAGVVILLNSPGGTPVQSGLINERITYLKEKYGKEVICVGQDMLTSGAYMIASACSEIYVNRSTIIGSIGVIMKNYGFSEIANKLGVEPRTYTAGQFKNRFDSSQPELPSDVEKAGEMLGKLHTQFKQVVRDGRGEKLKAEEAVLFSGDFWTGEEALELGLADGIMDVSAAVEKHFAVTNIKDFTNRSAIAQIIQQMRGGATAAMDAVFSTRTEFWYR